VRGKGRPGAKEGSGAAMLSAFNEEALCRCAGKKEAALEKQVKKNKGTGGFKKWRKGARRGDPRGKNGGRRCPQ